jgi:ATP-dependent RNA helicase RhlE
MPDSIVKLANTIVNNAKFVSVQPISSTAEKINQSVYFVEAPEKRKLLVHLLKDASIRSALVFTRTKHGANKVTKMLNLAHIKAEAIHGNKSQNARQMALKNFKAGDTRVLVATDIAARGIDIDELAYVINYEVPNIPETYVHRIGRTGRAGASGIAVSFCDREERAYLKDIQKLIQMDIPEATDDTWQHAVDVPDTKVEYGRRPAPPRNDRPAESGQGDAARKSRRKKPGYRRSN